jgi:hypothetical protein
VLGKVRDVPVSASARTLMRQLEEEPEFGDREAIAEGEQAQAERI